MNLTDRQKKKILDMVDILHNGEIAIAEKIAGFANELEDTKYLVDKTVTRVNDVVNKVNEQGLINYPRIINEVVKQIPPPPEIKIPTIDYTGIINKVVGTIQPKIDSISQPVEIDYEYIVSQILELTSKDELEGEIIRDKLENLTGDNRLAMGAIKDLDETIATLQNRTQLLNQIATMGQRNSNSSSGSGTTTNFVDNEIVSGSGTSFTLANTPIAGSVHLYGNGQRLKPGSGNDYTISGASITILSPATYSAGAIIADYRK